MNDEENDKIFSYNKKLSDGELCQRFIASGGLKSDGVNLLIKEGNNYRTVPAAGAGYELRRFITPATRMDLSKNRLDGVVKLLMEDPDIRVDANQRNSGQIAFRNGIYDINTEQLLPHDSEYRWAVVDANYLEDAKLEDAPAFLKFLRSSLDYDDDKDKAKLLLQIIGYSVSDYTSAKKAFFLVGEPSSGKSKALEFLQRLLGDADVSQVELSAIGGKFNSGLLYGKRINISTEISAKKFPPIEPFKRLVACDRSPGELKFKDAFAFYPRVKLLNAGNAVPFPANTDGTLSLIDRMTFLMFNHRIPRDDWDVDLVDHLLEERDVIITLAVNELKALVETNFTFVEPEDSKTFASAYSDALNAFTLFINERCMFDKNEKVVSTELWQAYQSFCDENAFPVGLTQQLFVQRVTALNGVTKVRERVNGGGQPTFFKGIALLAGQDKVIEAAEIHEDSEEVK